VRRVAGRLGGLARNAGVLGVIVALSSTAAGGAGTPARFELTIVATTHTSWDHTTAPVAANGCTTSQSSEGALTGQFRTRRPVRVRFVGGRIAPADVGPLDGTAGLTGTNTSNLVCGASESHTPQPCSETTLAFRGGKTHVSSTKPGSITLGRLRLHLRAVDCPQEPAELARDPLGPVPGPLRVSADALSHTGIARITLTASATRRFKYGPLEQGTLQERTFWRVTLLRVRP
jgi:hypothetical protein